jgi:2-amino-4-hydroxy-6-hydroxymethyldihydropteridine diphosphokinase
MATPAWISLGSNLGDRRAILDGALAELAEVPGVVVVAVSSYHETEPVGGPTGQGPFLNAAAELATDLDPHQLLEVLRRAEDHAGRLRTVRWGERTLDLDLLIHGSGLVDTKDLKVPHPRLAFRRFVIGPLAEIAPAAVDRMTGRTVADLLVNLDRRPRLLAIDGPEGRRKAGVFERLVEELPGFGIAAADLGPAALEGTPPPFAAEFARLEAKADALRASRWAAETLRVPWIVTDYFLDFDLLRASTLGWRDGRSNPERAERFAAHREGMPRARVAARQALAPTFALILPGDEESNRKPGMSTPRLWPESDKPDAIVAEVLAACRGIDGL